MASSREECSTPHLHNMNGRLGEGDSHQQGLFKFLLNLRQPRHSMFQSQGTESPSAWFTTLVRHWERDIAPVQSRHSIGR